MYDASIPVLEARLVALDKMLDKAAAYAEAKKFDAAVLLGARLAPDMFPLVRQVQLATDFAKGCGTRLAGVPVPKFEDTETTIPELKARIGKTLDLLRSLDRAAIDSAADRDITVGMRSGDRHFKGKDFLLGFALPHFYFHVTTAYGLLRHNGLEIGKADFIG
jgi:hypothetical protein